MTEQIKFLEIDLDAFFAGEWFKGKPPSVGWWQASINRAPSVLRWWNGVEWSYPVDRFIGMDEVIYCADLPSNCQDQIEWKYRPWNWPDRSFT